MADPKFREISGYVDTTGNSMSRLLRKDTGPANRFPGEVTIGARKKGVASILFYANGSAGNYSTQIPLNYATTPLSMVWFMGWRDKVGVIGQGGGIVPGSNFDSGTVLSGMEIFSGATANYSCDATNLTIKLTSTNVGYSDFVVAYFYYSIYYDLIELPPGL